MWTLGANNKLFLENPAFSPNIAKFDFTNTVIIMRKIGSDLPSPNMYILLDQYVTIYSFIILKYLSKHIYLAL